MPANLFTTARSAALAISLCLGVPAAYAASPDGTYVSKGAGPQTCAVFVAEREKQSPDYDRFLGWIEGYVTHYNKVTQDTTDILSWQRIELVAFLLNNFCNGNPNSRFDVAAETLLASLHPSRLRTVSEVVEIPGSTPPQQIYKVVVQRIQQTLTERGFYAGNIDGDYGPATIEAVKKFQTSEKREPTGVADQVTLLLLFR